MKPQIKTKLKISNCEKNLIVTNSNCDSSNTYVSVSSSTDRSNSDIL